MAALSSSSPNRPPAFILLSVHEGQLLTSPTAITDQFASEIQSTSSFLDPQDRSIDYAAWLSLDPPDEPIGDPDHKSRSVGRSVCDRLPANLFIRPMVDLNAYASPLVLDLITNPRIDVRTFKCFCRIGNAAAASYPPQASAKPESPYSLVHFPPSTIKDSQSLTKLGTASLLILSSHINRIHFFINGTIYLGSTTLPDRVQLRSVRLMRIDSADIPDTPRIPTTHLGAVRLQLFWLKIDGYISYGYLDLKPACQPLSVASNQTFTIQYSLLAQPTLATLGIRSKELHDQIDRSDLLHGLLRNCFFGYFNIVKDWHISRCSARKWYENFDEISKAHGGMHLLS